MRKFATWAKRGLVVLSPLALFAAMSASAAPSENSVPSAVREALQRDLGLAPGQLAQYLKVERQALQMQRQLANAQGDRYAGSWLERKANGDYQLVVASTSLQPQRGPADTEIRSVRHSLAALGASKRELDTLTQRGGKAPDGVYGWFVDVRNNSVTVNVARSAELLKDAGFKPE